MKQDEKIPRQDFKDVAEEEDNKPFFATRRGNVLSVFILIAIILIVTMFVFGGGGSSLTYAASDTTFGITFLNTDPIFIEYRDITGLTLDEGDISGNPVEPLDWDSGFAGIYENSEWGDFYLYAYSDTGMYIVIEYTDGVLVFNGKNKRSTRSIYKTLSKNTGIES